MEGSIFTPMRSPYDSLLEKERWGEYISGLCQDGIQWWFNMDMPSLLCHLAPLNGIPPETSRPLRLAFLSDSVNPSAPIESMEKFHQLFIEEDDLEAASAAAAAGAAAVFDAGSDLTLLDVWSERIEDLLGRGDGVSPLARASLLGFKGMIEFVYRGDVARASETYKEQLRWAERAHSHSLRVFHAAGYGHVLLYLGDLHGMDLLLSEVTPLLEHPETSPASRLYHQITLGILHVNRGNLPEAKKILGEMMSHPLFDLLPPRIWLLGSSHFFLATALGGDRESAEAVSRKIQDRTVPDLNYFQEGYVHFVLGEASLWLGDPYKALIHSRQAIETGRLSGSPVPERVGSLLMGQALSDLGRTQEAMGHLGRWVDEWERTGYYLLASAGCLELAGLLIKEGKVEEARKYYERPSTFLPHAEGPPLNPMRPAGFLEKLRYSLYPAAAEVGNWADADWAAVRVQTFGQFLVRIRDNIVYDRKWQGGRTKALLKALVVCGGTKVPTDLLIDWLWADSDGDKSARNLKMALSRLRHTGCEKGELPLPWILVRHRQVSLARGLCSVDCILFHARISTAMRRNDDVDLYLGALDLYTDDFLANDRSHLWIIRHRELLRGELVRGVKALAGLCLTHGNPDLAIPYLERTVEKDPLDEDLWVHLMRAHLGTGNPARALKAFRNAAEALKRGLDLEPGPALTALAREAGLKSQ